MRIILDLQGAQSESRFRGIGRYSLALARAIVQNAGPHEIWLALSGLYPESVDALRLEFYGLIPPERMRVFELPGSVAEINLANTWRTHAAELLREKFLADLKPDLVHVSSPFEGLHYEVVTSIGRLRNKIPTAVTLYDLIPLKWPELFLSNFETRRWYKRHAQNLQRADLLLAISESSRQEAVDHLNIDAERIINISAGLNQNFRLETISAEERSTLMNQCGIQRPFILCAGTVDPHKNLAGLIEAFALLPEAIRSAHQLAVVGKMHQEECKRFLDLAHQQGLAERELAFTGYLSDADLRRLYNSCALFVLPSFHEGFGLPALEAMACGAAVIGANRASVPEIINRDDALFDPSKPDRIAERIAAVLSSPGLQEDLKHWGKERAKEFTWESCASKAWQAFEVLHAARQGSVFTIPDVAENQRPLLAFVSPLPPEQTPAADFAVKLLPSLARYYEIVCVVDQPEVRTDRITAAFTVQDLDWFKKKAGDFDRIVYQFANAPSHKHMFALLERHPGVSFLNDYSLGPLFNWMEDTGFAPGYFAKALYHSHGYSALLELKKSGLEHTVKTYPANAAQIRSSIGFVSKEENDLTVFWYGKKALENVRQMPPNGMDEDPEQLALCYYHLIETFYRTSSSGLEEQLIKQIVCGLVPAQPTSADLAKVAAALSANRRRFGPRQLLIDVTNVSRTQAHTGIQRVTRALLLNLLTDPPEGYRVEPVRAEGRSFIYARQFACRCLGLPDHKLNDEAIETHPEDIFLAVEWGADTIPALKPWLLAQRRRGVQLIFTVFDLLPVLCPHFFPPAIAPLALEWITTVAEVAHGLVCISRTVTDELERWLEEKKPNRSEPLPIGFFHLGADLHVSLPGGRSPLELPSRMTHLGVRPTFLMVGTVEPRKGYQQALEAMETLWADGTDVNLVMVGKEGWNMSDLATRIAAHPENDKRLFWMRDVKDELLEQLYRNARALLAASEGEGFGLPLIEAAQYGIPIIARDIPVFREIAGPRAYYFTGDAATLARALKTWLSLGENVPSSRNLKWLSWHESSRQLLNVILNGNWSKRWQPGEERIAYSGANPSLTARDDQAD